MEYGEKINQIEINSRRFCQLTLQYSSYLGRALKVEEDRLEFEQALDRAVAQRSLGRDHEPEA